jgi:hypothetical protein
MYSSGWLDDNWILTIPLVFPELNLKGTVLNQYLLLKSRIDVNVDWGIIEYEQHVQGIINLGKSSSVLEGSEKTIPFDDPSSYALADNITPGSNPETAVPITGDLKLADIGDLNTAGYSARFQAHAHGLAASDGQMEFIFNLYRMGFLIEFEVSPYEYDFYVRGLARVDGSDVLIENPALIIKDFFDKEVPDFDTDNYDVTSIGVFETARTNWKLATTLFTES